MAEADTITMKQLRSMAQDPEKRQVMELADTPEARRLKVKRIKKGRGQRLAPTF